MNEKKQCFSEDMKAEQRLKDYATKQFNCGHSCRICPYPGAKCREDDAVARKIQ